MFNKVNVALFIVLAGLTYAATLYIEGKKPSVIVQPDIAVQGFDLGMKTPDFTFEARDGRVHEIGDFEGKIVILNFWASWCPPCVKEFPLLLRAAAEFKDDVVLIALSSDLSQEAMDRFLKKLAAGSGDDLGAPNVFIALDEGQAVTGGVFQTFQLPETVLIDGQQVLRQKIIGGDWTYESFTQQIKMLQSTIE